MLMLSLLISFVLPLLAHGFMLSSFSCEGSNQGKYLGIPRDVHHCQQMAQVENEVGECSWFMHSPMYSWAWGCRCCRDHASFTYHTLWNLHWTPDVLPSDRPRNPDCKNSGEPADFDYECCNGVDPWTDGMLGDRVVCL